MNENERDLPTTGVAPEQGEQGNPGVDEADKAVPTMNDTVSEDAPGEVEVEADEEVEGEVA